MTSRECLEVSAACPVSGTTYGYYPVLGGNIFFATFFGICLIFQLILGVYHRTWTFMIAVSIGALMECLGYVGRVMMHSNPWNESAFELQICCLVLAPSFIAAGFYLSLKHIVLYTGPESSRLKPKLYTWLFIGCDLGSIILQAIGGGTAAAAGHEKNVNRSILNAGNHLIVAGIAFQVATMAVCGIVAIDFALRLRKRSRSAPVSDEKVSSDVHFRVFCYAIAVAFAAVWIRCIYRLPEMAGGWGNPIMQREKPFLVLDGGMVALATLSMTLFHPGIWFPQMRKGKKAVASSSDAGRYEI